MPITLETLGLALLLVVVLETLVPSLAPRTWQKMLANLAQASTAQVQKIALMLLVGALTVLLMV